MRIIVGISGASGAILGADLLRAFKRYGCETHLVITAGAEGTLKIETGLTVKDLAAFADFVHPIGNLAASISSGSFKTDGMVIAPCSMKTLAGIVCGYTDNLLLRAADVCLKERRKVVLLPRELPLSSIHLGNMEKAARHGCIVCPPVMTFYNKPKSIQDMIDHLTGKVMMLFGLEFSKFKPWAGEDAL